MEFNSYVLRNYTYIQGFVKNNGSVDAAGIQIAVSLLGDADDTVGAGQAHIGPALLKAGARSPWLVQVQGVPKYKEIKVQVQGQPSAGFLASMTTQDFRLDGVTVRPPVSPFPSPTISGQVFNTAACVRTDRFVKLRG